MRSIGLSLFLFLVAPLADATAQTTGVPGVNDFTVNGIAPASTSCGLAILTGLPLTFSVSAAPNAPLAIFLNTCPCRAGAFPFPSNPCTAPLLQSLDIPIGVPGCVTVTLVGSTGPGGVYNFTLPPCSSPFRFSTQAVVLDPACPPYLLTQAYQVSC